jgi:hypothetical protein
MRIFVLLPLLIVLGTSFSAAQDAKSELRTWTAVNGKELEAEFVSNSDGQVSLKMKTGKIFKVPLNKLSKADQDFLKVKSSPKEPTKGEAPVSPESQLIGYWALNAEKIIKAIEADPPDGATAEELKESGPALRELLREWIFIVQLAEGGKLNVYDAGAKEVGTYSLVVDDKTDAPIRIDVEMDSEKFVMILTGETLKITPPAGAQLKFPLLATRINAAEAKQRLAQFPDANEDIDSAEVRLEVQTQIAKVSVRALEQAISSYQLEYGRFPFGGDQDVELNTEDDEIMSILAGVPGNPLNRREKVFYQGKRAKSARGGEPVGGIYGEGDNLMMADPWGQPYHLIIDANDDNKVHNPKFDYGGEDTLRGRSVIVWSTGKPRKKGVANDPKDWHTSW